MASIISRLMKMKAKVLLLQIKYKLKKLQKMLLMPMKNMQKVWNKIRKILNC